MEKEFIIALFLDVRRKKSIHKYPVKIRVYHTLTKTARLYPTKFEYSDDDFKKAWKAEKAHKNYHEERQKLQAFDTLLNEIAGKIAPFSFEQFERKYLRKKGDTQNLLYHYDQAIIKLKANNQFANAYNYSLSKKSVEDYMESLTGHKPTKMFFSEITPAWLTKYEFAMLHRKKPLKRSHELSECPLSRTTISIYLRVLRTVFNNAISEKDIDQEVYPFGKNKYQLPAVQGVKKALTSDQLNTLYFATPRIPEQEKARDFWFFSYACNGMNLKDIAMLRWENIQEETLIFYRAKTINTGKTHLKPVTAYITDHVKYVIDKYGNKDRGPKKLIFPIVSDDHDEETKFLTTKNFTRFVNQNLKNLARNNGITGKISSYWARHSFATNAIRNGATMEFVSESLSHTNLRTTQSYFAGFEDKDKKEFMKNLMTFTQPKETEQESAAVNDNGHK